MVATGLSADDATCPQGLARAKRASKIFTFCPGLYTMKAGRSPEGAMPYSANTVRRIWADRFKRYSLLLLLVLGLVLIIVPSGDQLPRQADQGLLPVATVVELPLLGLIDAREYSLPVLAVILGLVDGFNPCAMWVLVYLISLILALKDRRKVWLLVGSFVLGQRAGHDRPGLCGELRRIPVLRGHSGRIHPYAGHQPAVHGAVLHPPGGLRFLLHA